MLLFVVQTNPRWVQGAKLTLPCSENDTLVWDLFSEQLVDLCKAAIGEAHVLVIKDDKRWHDGTVYDEASYVVHDVVAVYADRSCAYRTILTGLVKIAERLVGIELQQQSGGPVL